MFERDPFKKCPLCGKENFGVLDVYAHSYTRRCRDCRFSESYNLPRIDKKVIYLDQFAVSDMMKAINEEHDSNQRLRDKDFWVELFSTLDKLAKMQLIICPESETHAYESSMSDDFSRIIRMLEQLSRTVRFKNFHWIETVQFHENFKAWLDGKATYEFNPSRERVIGKEYSAWTGTMFISTGSSWAKNHEDSIRAERDNLYKGVVALFEFFKDEKKFNFQTALKKEIRAFGDSILYAKRDYQIRIKQFAYKAVLDPDSTDLMPFPPQALDFLNVAEDELSRRGIPAEEHQKKIEEYFAGDLIGEIPFLMISAHLWAKLARKAASGQKEPPNKGTFNDFKTISTLLPYCDAMLIDNAMYAYLQEMPLAEKIEKYGKVFCPRTKMDFLEYLKAIEMNCLNEHKALLTEVFGERWRNPNVEMYRYFDNAEEV